MKLDSVFRHLPTIKTDRLVLRKMKLTDASDIYEYASDDEVSKSTNWSTHKSVEDSESYLRAMIKRYSYNQASEWCMVHKATGKVIGTCGFVNWAPKHYSAEIGYSLARKFWNQGLTTEAILKVIEYGFEEMHLNRIEARCQNDNPASERVMQKVGMKFEGVHREAMFVKNYFRTLKFYSILYSEYKANKGKP